MQITSLINKRSETIIRLDAIVEEIKDVIADGQDWASFHQGRVDSSFYRDRDDLIQEHQKKFSELENIESELAELKVEISDGAFERHYGRKF